MKSAIKQSNYPTPAAQAKRLKKTEALHNEVKTVSKKKMIDRPFAQQKASTTHKTLSMAAADVTKSVLLNREEAILQFNYRVLAQAQRTDVPLLERLRYLCIVSSNIDEFFEVRMPPLLFPVNGVNRVKNPSSVSSSQTFEQVCALAQTLVEQQYALYNDVLIPALSKAGIEILQHGERNEAQREWVAAFFQREVRPLLIPIGLDPAHPFPQVANKSLNFIVRLKGKDAFGRENHIAIVKVPRILPRVIRLPKKIAPGKQAFVLLSSVIRAHLFELFPGREIDGFSQFRVTRDSDLWVDEQEAGNLRQALRSGLVQRHFGNAVRLEVASACPTELSSFLLNQFKLPEQALFKVHGPVNLVRLNALIEAIDPSAAKELLFSPYEPAWPRSVNPQLSLFEQLKQGDFMLHLPFESFEPTLVFLRQAVADPQVLAIKQTIYRAGSDSALMELLIQAAQRGKEVTVVVELKARFDEEANINWAERLEQVGAQVVYGVVGLKTHAKMLLITRRESVKGSKQLMRYAHLSTGNYNPRTARLYADVAMFTAHPEITADVEQVFQHLASQSKIQTLKHLWLAPFSLHKQLIEHIAAVRDAARGKKPARIVAKMNALLDNSLIEALVEAACAGADIDLIVRGACTLPAGLKAYSERIRVRSVIGRFLEHSRVFYFRAAKQESLYLASADWMGRNIFRRIEIAWPVLDKNIRQRIIDEVLTPYLQDGVDAWQQHSDGNYIRALSEQPSAQQALMLRYGNAKS